MARDAQNQAKQSFQQAQGLTNQYNANAQGTYGALSPELRQEAVNPMGLTPEEKSNMITGSMQALGGSQAGAVGAGNLEAARTRNVGGADAAIAEAARQAGRQQSANALTVAGADTNLKEEQRQAGLKGEQDVLGLETGSTLGALGAQTGATNALTEAGKSGWFQNMIAAMNAAANVGTSAAGMGMKPCWIAAELYGGWNSPRVTLLRDWMLNDWRTVKGRVFVAMYILIGKPVAWLIHRSRLARVPVKYVFDRLLQRAQGGR